MNGRDLNAKVTHIMGNVNDTVLNNSAPVRLASKSGWDQFMGSSSTAGRTLTFNNYDDQAALLIPRAVAYSAAFLDFFFRGRLEISAPDTGIYAITDHAVAQTIAPLDNWTGFTGIKLRIAAPGTDNNGEPQTLAGGQLRAVLKFRRDRCYSNTLSTFPSTAAEAESCRSEAEEIVTSDPANGGQMIALGQQPQEISFKFPRALPINATDVYVQVVYRGALVTGGVTEADAIVVATKSISEPTYFSYLNGTDYWRIDNNIHTRAQIAVSPTLLNKITLTSCVDRSDPENPVLLDTCLKPIELDYEAVLGEGQGISLKIEKMPVRTYMRVAYLTDRGRVIPISSPSGNCPVNEPDHIPAMEWKDNFTLQPAEISLRYTILNDIRSTRANAASSCVNVANSFDPKVKDDRDTVWKGLADVQVTPFLTKINGGMPYP
jgi:hypothetical protein